MSIIIGIDPGSRHTGFGVIEHRAGVFRYVASGTIHAHTKQQPDMPARIGRIVTGISEAAALYKPDEAAVEQVFMASNPDSALKLGQARGAAIAALVAQQLPVYEYTARQIKQSVVGYGAAQKEQVQAMVCQLLALSSTPEADAADALACAICHAHANHSLGKLLGGSTLRRSVGRKKGRWRL